VVFASFLQYNNSRAMSIFGQGLFEVKANCYTLEKNRQRLAKLKVPKNSFSKFVQ
jgi:hypothetical protein